MLHVLIVLMRQLGFYVFTIFGSTKRWSKNDPLLWFAWIQESTLINYIIFHTYRMARNFQL